MKVVGDLFIEMHVVSGDFTAAGKKVIKVTKPLSIPVFNSVEVENLYVGRVGLNIWINGARHAEIDNVGAVL